MTPSTRFWIWGTLLVAVLVPFLNRGELPVVEFELDESDEEGHEYVSSRLGYAPIITGPYLTFFSYFLARSLIAPWFIRRMLVGDNIHIVRVLAAKKCLKLPPTSFPMHKVDGDAMEQAQSWVDSNPNILQTGLDLQHKSATSHYYSVMDYHQLYQSGKVLPTEVMERLIQGENQLSHLKIFSCFRPDNIRSQAEASKRRWEAGRPLSVWDGVPVAIKDQSSVAGMRICEGSSGCREASEDDIPAERFRQAGAIVVGMTVMTEGGLSPLGYSAHFDGPFNAYNVEYYPGGSSSGSAVAVASGLVPVTLGWDGGGSVRIPASMSGTLGLAPTFGRIPHNDSRASTVTKAGPLAASMTDIALAYLLLGQVYPGSFYAELIGEAYLPPPHLNGLIDKNGHVIPNDDDKPLDGVRLGIYWEQFQDCDIEVYTKCLEVVRFMESQGATLVNVTIPHMREIHRSHTMKILSEFGVLWESRFFNTSYHLEGNTRVILAMGRELTAVELLAGDKVRTFAIDYIRNRLYRDLKLDAIVSPTLAVKVPKPSDGYRGYGESNNALLIRVMQFAPLANLVGLPAVSIPVGYEDESGLPIGFQLLGDAWSEPVLIRLGRVVEGFHPRRRPPSENFFDMFKPWCS